MAMTWGMSGRNQDFCMGAILLNTPMPRLKKDGFFGGLDYFRVEPNLIDMIPLEKIFTRVFFRTMLADFGFRNPYRLKQWEFTPYFQYRIGPYVAGPTLCFRRKPYLELYKNEIFNKMTEYSGYDVVR